MLGKMIGNFLIFTFVVIANYGTITLIMERESYNTDLWINITIQNICMYFLAWFVGTPSWFGNDYDEQMFETKEYIMFSILVSNMIWGWIIRFTTSDGGNLWLYLQILVIYQFIIIGLMIITNIYDTIIRRITDKENGKSITELAKEMAQKV